MTGRTTQNMQQKLCADLAKQIDALLEPVPAFLALLRHTDSPYGRYRYFPDSPRPWCMYASVSGIGMELKLDLVSRWSDAQRHEALNSLRDCQSKIDHYFHCPVCQEDQSDPHYRCGESKTQLAGMTKKAVYLLTRLGEKPHHLPPVDKQPFADSVEDWLQEVFDNNDRYGAGSIVGHVMGAYNQGLIARGKDPLQDPIIKATLAWLLARQDPDTGLFLPQDNLVLAMNGLLKMRYGLFELTGTPIPMPNRIVPTLLGLQRDDGRFGDACADFNAVSLLGDLGKRAPQHHHEIVSAFQNVLPALKSKQRPNGGLCWEPNDTRQPDLNATTVNVQALVDMKTFLQ